MEKKDVKKLIILAVFFVVFYFLPAELGRVSTALNESVQMMSEYAKAHVLLCLIPAFFIAGAISVFVRSNSVMKYLGAAASMVVAYSVASVSGAILAVCSCTVLPLFAGIYMRGAGLGPATSFLYSGPAINVLAIIMTARILGPELGTARAVGAVVLSVIVGLLMAFIYRKEEKQRLSAFEMDKSDGDQVDLWRVVLLIGAMIGFLIFANWGAPQGDTGLWQAIYSIKWYASGFFLLATVIVAFLLFKKDILKKWLQSTVEYVLKVTPLLFIGVLVAGFLLGRPGHEALIPSSWISGLVGGNSIFSNLFASVSGALMYFATLTEVPILQGLMGAGMGKGPALALLLAGPALSLPAMLVIAKVLKWKKTLTYVGIVVVVSTIAGIVYGMF
ncbi:MAG: permease [Bacillota bacterium]